MARATVFIWLDAMTPGGVGGQLKQKCDRERDVSAARPSLTSTGETTPRMSGACCGHTNYSNNQHIDIFHGEGESDSQFRGKRRMGSSSHSKRVTKYRTQSRSLASNGATCGGESTALEDKLAHRCKKTPGCKGLLNGPTLDSAVDSDDDALGDHLLVPLSARSIITRTAGRGGVWL